MKRIISSCISQAVVVLITSCILIFPIAAHAALSPEVEKGLAWLQSQIQTDGTLAGENTAIATPFQSRAETQSALHALAAVNTALANAITADTEDNTEYLARRIIAATGAAEQIPPATLTQLFARQNPDGGFGGESGDESNPLETAWVLLSLEALNNQDAVKISAALNYLAQSKQINGAWGSDGQSNTFITSLVLLAANEWKDRYPVATITLAARDWLTSQTINGVLGTSLDNAVCLLALATQTSQATVLQPLADSLKTNQMADGSWNGDPYITALALRALWFSGNPPIVVTVGGLSGMVIDAQSKIGLAGATVQMVENSSLATMTLENGSYLLSNFSPGQYTLRISKLGYEARQLAIQITAGEILDVAAIGLLKASLSASLSGVIKGQNGSPLQDVIVSVGTASTSTNASGAYQLSEINPGEVAVTASKVNYQTASATVNFAAGITYIFSPTLYATNVTPPAPTLRGKVVDAATNTAIINASVTLGQITKTTLADGKFEFTNVPTNAFVLSISAAGYPSTSASGSVVSGINDVGNIALTKLPASSSISGTVTDAQSGNIIPGATVAIQGTNLSATSDVNGNYQISGLDITDFRLLVTAPDYLSGNINVKLAQVGAATVNLVLLKVQPSGIKFDAVTPSKDEYSPSEELIITVEVLNSAITAASLTIDAQVMDAQNNVTFQLQANANGAGQNPPNLPLIFASGSKSNIYLEKFMIRQAAGVYTAIVRAYDSNGLVVAEANTQFSVRDEIILNGGVILDPPIAQAGTNSPVRINALLSNYGNQPVPAGQIDLVVSLVNPDTIVNTQPQTNFKTLTTGTPMNNPQGLVVDAAGNLYTVNNNANDGKIIKIDPQGVQSVFATVPSNKAPSLSGLVMDAQGNIWVTNKSGGKVWQVNPLGVASELIITSLDVISGIDFATSGNLVLTGSKSGVHRLVRRTTQGVESVLWENGFTTPVAVIKDNLGNLIVSNQGDNTLIKVSMNGTITPFVSGLNRPMGLAADDAGNIYVANNGAGQIVKVSGDGTRSIYATGPNAPVDIEFDSSGILYVSAQTENAIYRVLTNGSVELFARGIANGPQGMKYDAAGNLYIANNDGTLRMKDVTDQSTVLATGLSSPRGLDVNSAGDIFVANYASGSISKISGTTKTNFATGLSNPYGVAIDNTGNINITEYGLNRITQYDPSGTLISRVESLFNSPTVARVANNGRIYILNSTHITVIENGIPRIFFRDFALTAISPDPVNGGLWALRGSDVYRINEAGIATKIKALTFSPTTNGNMATDAAGNAIINDYNAKKIVKLDTAGTVTTLVNLSDYPRTVVSDYAGVIYVLQYPNQVLKLAEDGSSNVLFSTTESISGLSMASDGRPLIWTSSSKIYSIDPMSGISTLIKSNIAPKGVAIDASNQLYLTYIGSENNLVTYNQAGIEVSRLTGFTSPSDIIWTGSELRFVDTSNLLFRMTPGNHPSKIASGFTPKYLAQRGVETYGATGGAIYKWDGSSVKYIMTLNGVSSLSGIAANNDGMLSVADNTNSRVITLNNNNGIASDFAGIVGPQGLAFDAQGRLYVANTGSSTIAKMDVGNKVVSTFARISAPSYLDFDTTDNLWVSRSNFVDKINPQGIVSNVSSNLSLQGILVDDSGVFGVDQGGGRLRKWIGQTWGVFAAGLSTPEGVRVAGSGEIYVANSGNGTVTKLMGGKLDVIASELASPHALALSADGKIYASGNSGGIYQLATDGQLGTGGVATDLGLSALLGSKAVYGIAQVASGKYAVVTRNGTASSVSQIMITQAAIPPVAGTVVYRTQQSIAGIAVGEAQLPVDFGTWIPPYGGDFKFEVSHPDAADLAQNYLHVGSYAQGIITTTTPNVYPGNQTIAMNLKLTGADFTTISKVETGLVRKLVPISFPKGMIGDKAGNIWFTDSSTLKKTTTSGVTTTVLSGIAPVFGLAIDANEQIYLPVKNGVRYELIKVLTDGSKTTVADLGTTTVNGVAVNSMDEVLVGSFGKLLKYSPVSNAVTIVSNDGIPQPRGIAIDGRDNVYVQNENHFVSMIKPDGATVSLFAKADGVQDPVFEGDGYPNITADCADNFYIAPFEWSKIKQSGEEHILAQVVPRTGNVSGILDGLQINSQLRDIDYLAYDRFGSRILMWNHTDSAIWQVPVTCGAIGVEAHLMSKPGQTLTGFSRAPNAAVTIADGSTEYVWSLRDVTAKSVSIGFDTLLTNLGLGEQRATLDSAYILFKNSFSTTDVKLPLEIPMVQAANLVNLGITTDRSEYLANAEAQVTTLLSNTNPRTIVGDLSVDVYDSANILVGNIARQSTTMTANQTMTLDHTYPIGTIIPGIYTVRATLTDNGILQATAITTFKVLADNSQAITKTSVSVDKLRYTPIDTVAIASSATNQSANVFLENLLLNVKVFNSADSLLFNKTYPIAQLAPGNPVNFISSYPMRNTDAGIYHVEQLLSDASGLIYDTQTATFEVESTAVTGSGLRGTISVVPKVVPHTDAVILNVSVTNMGNAEITALPITVSVVDPVTQNILMQQTYSELLAQGATFQAAFNWNTNQASAGITYVAVLTATVGDTPLTLAQDNFTVIEPPVKLDVQQTFNSTSRVLVLLSCQDNQGNKAVCTQTRLDFLDQYLTTLGIEHRLVTDDEAFRDGLRSGNYNTYWLSGGGEKLHDTIGEELREALYRGDVLILDGVHDERNKILEEAAGTLYRGKLSPTDLPVSVSDAPFTATELASQGRALHLELAGATQHALFGGIYNSNGAPYPAILSHTYGQGKTLTFAFDLPGSLQIASLQLQAAPNDWQTLLLEGLSHIRPSLPGIYGSREHLLTRTEIKNLASDASLTVNTRLPTGSVLLSSLPLAALDANGNPAWALNLPADQTQVLTLALRLPPASGTYRLETTIDTTRNGITRHYGDYALSINLSAALDSASGLSSDIAALVVNQSEHAARDHAAIYLNDALSLTNSGQYSAALNKLVNAVEALRQIQSVDVSSYRLQLDQLLREMAYHTWCAAANPRPMECGS